VLVPPPPSRVNQSMENVWAWAAVVSRSNNRMK
jgi:hypothetical protein